MNISNTAKKAMQGKQNLKYSNAGTCENEENKVDPPVTKSHIFGTSCILAMIMDLFE